MCSATYFVKSFLEKFYIQISQFLLKIPIYWLSLTLNKLFVLLCQVLARAGSHCPRMNRWLQKVMLEIMVQSNHSFTSSHAVYCCTPNCFVQATLISSIVFGSHSVFCIYLLLRCWLAIKIFPKFTEATAEEEDNNEW